MYLYFELLLVTSTIYMYYVTGWDQTSLRDRRQKGRRGGSTSERGKKERVKKTREKRGVFRTLTRVLVSPPLSFLFRRLPRRIGPN